MGLFGALADLASATVKVAITPVAVVADVVSVATGNEADNTKKLLKSACDDVIDSSDEITGGRF